MPALGSNPDNMGLGNDRVTLGQIQWQGIGSGRNINSPERLVVHRDPNGGIRARCNRSDVENKGRQSQNVKFESCSSPERRKSRVSRKALAGEKRKRVGLPPGAGFVCPPAMVPDKWIGVFDGVRSTQKRVAGGCRASLHDLSGFEHAEPYNDSLEQMREHDSD